jgi:hypothetical protein
LPGLGNTTTGISLAGQYDIIAASRTSGASVLVNRNTDDGDLIQFSQNGSTVGLIGVENSDLTIGTGDTGLQFRDASDAIRPFNTSTNSARDASIDLGRSSERFRSLFLSGGVYLGGTGSANHLDDYEIGNWTPEIWKGSTQVTSPTSVFGKYRKIGDVIFYSFYFFKSSGSNTDSGNWKLKGMPFAMEVAAASGYTSLTAGYTGINSVNYFNQTGSHRWQNNGSSLFDLYGPQSTTQWTSGHIEFAACGFVYQA